MKEYIEIAGAVITLIGTIFLFLGSLGLIRMPDVFNRIQTGTKATTLGTMLTLLGVGIMHFDWAGKIVVLIIFVLVTNPVSSHVLARAAYHIGIPLTSKTVVDKLAKKRPTLTVKKKEAEVEKEEVAEA